MNIYTLEHFLETPFIQSGDDYSTSFTEEGEYIITRERTPYDNKQYHYKQHSLGEQNLVQAIKAQANYTISWQRMNTGHHLIIFTGLRYYVANVEVGNVHDFSYFLTLNIHTLENGWLPIVFEHMEHLERDVIKTIVFNFICQITQDKDSRLQFLLGSYIYFVE